jgi:hypothetical protein
MKISFSLILQFLPLALMGLAPILNYGKDKKTIQKLAQENLWWDISIKKVSKPNKDRTYQVSYQDLDGKWYSKYCVFKKTGMEWEEEVLQKEINEKN